MDCTSAQTDAASASIASTHPTPYALIVDDDRDFSAGLAELAEHNGFTASTARTLAEARAHIGDRLPDVLLMDLMLPDGNGLELLRQLDGHAAVDIVLVTGHASVDTAVEALRHRVSDYLIKPVDVARLSTVLSNVARARALRNEIDTLRSELCGLGHFGLLLGASPAMETVYDLIARVAATDASVVLTGESGTGKDLTAQTLHQLSHRRQAPFLAVNCGAISSNLIESELFGHERGSFTGAERVHHGFFERAHGGTLFLDEITEMPLELQSKLLRVLETGTVIRVGGERAIQVDVRIIAASNRELSAAVEAGKVRTDLLYRLNVFSIHLPALRERGDDVELLAATFLESLNAAESTHKTLSSAALERLRAYSWPGNVRELKNTLHRAFILSEDEIQAEWFPQPILNGGGSAANSAIFVNVATSLAAAERQLIAATVEHYKGDRKKAAQVLGISVKTLHNRLHSYEQP